MSDQASKFHVLCDQARQSIEVIDVEALAHLIGETEENFILLDVREDYEWDEGRIFGAIHMGRGLLECMIEEILEDKSAPIIVCCRGGNRSVLAAKSLKDLGYTSVRSLKGGVTAWVEAGLEFDGELMTKEAQLSLLKAD